MSALLRSCGFCGGHWLGHDSPSMGGVYLCPKHNAAMWKGFDPQPGSTVCYIDGPQRVYVVLSRQDDALELRLLGRPESPQQPTSLSMLWPGPGHVFEAISQGLRGGDRNGLT